jgi:hypothetical protein
LSFAAIEDYEKGMITDPEPEIDATDELENVNAGLPQSPR